MIITYECEKWTIIAAMQKKIQAFENKSPRKLLTITYQERKTKMFVRNRMIELIGNYEPFLQIIKLQLKLFGHISGQDNLCKTIMRGAVEGSINQIRPQQK